MIPVWIIVYKVIMTICAGFCILGIYQKNTNAVCKSKRRLDGKTAIVTGGSSGMGLEIAKDLASRGAKVFIVCPFEEEGQQAKELIITKSGNNNVIFQNLDLSSFASIRRFSDYINNNEERLDILVNNAGVGGNLSEKISGDGYNFMIQVNYLGPVLLTFLLLPLLKRTGNVKEPSRIVNTTSFTHFVGKLQLERWKKTGSTWIYYPSSKLCICLFTRELSRRLESFDVVVNVVDPGLAATPMFKNSGMLEPLLVFIVCVCMKNAWEGAQTAIFAAVSDDARDLNGKYLSNCRVDRAKRIPSSFEDYNMCTLLWEKTLETLQLDESNIFGNVPS